MHWIRRCSSAATALTVVLMAVAPADAAPRHRSGTDDVAAVIDDYVERQVDQGVVGLQVAVVRGDTIVHTAAAGDAGNGRPMTTTTPSRLESLSKSFTATAVMQLVDRGSVELDEPAQTYLPELTLDDPRAAAITVRHLLTQTSGLADRATPDAFPDGPRDLEQRVASLRAAHLVAAPGREFHYHNANYAILARLVEVVARERFAVHLRRTVLSPLDMRDTVDTATSTTRVPGMAAGHMTAFGRGWAADGPDYFVDGSGGLVSTADDMARWLVLQQGDGRSADGTRVVSAAGLQEMHRPQSGDGADYALGWYTAESAEGPPVRTSHSGAGAAYGAYQGLFTESGWSVAVLVNHGAGLTAADPAVLGQNLLAAVDPDIPTMGSPSHGLRTDLILTALLLLSLALVIRGTARSRRWADRRRTRSRVVTIARLVPLLSIIALVAAVPTLQLVLTDRTAPWPVLFTVEPVATVWLLTLGTGTLVVLTIRLAWLVLTAHGATSVASRAPGEGPRRAT